MKNVSGPEVVTTRAATEMPLPAEIQAALGEMSALRVRDCSR
jgi:hypothetical protein